MKTPAGMAYGDELWCHGAISVFRFGRYPLESSIEHRQEDGYDTINVHRQIAALRDRLAALDRERSEIVERLSALERARADEANPPTANAAPVTKASSTAAKIALFRSLFRGREDVLPRRWENPKTGRTGYAPVCRNEWVHGVWKTAGQVRRMSKPSICPGRG